MTSTQPATTTTAEPHVYNATSCDTPIAPTQFMCPPHWSQIPPSLRESIEATHQQGIDTQPSNEYLAYAAAAIAEIAHKENRQRKRTPSKPTGSPPIPAQLALFNETPS